MKKTFVSALLAATLLGSSFSTSFGGGFGAMGARGGFGTNCSLGLGYNAKGGFGYQYW